MERNSGIVGPLIVGMTLGSMLSALLAAWITLYYIDERENARNAPQQTQCGGGGGSEVEEETMGNIKT